MPKSASPEYLLCKYSYEAVMQMKDIGLHLKDFIIAHIPNENEGGSAEQRKIRGSLRKKMGVMPGVADYIVLWDGGCGFIEVKTKKGLYGAKSDGRLSEEQEKFRDWCIENDIKWSLTRTPQEMVDTLIEWRLLKSV